MLPGGHLAIATCFWPSEMLPGIEGPGRGEPQGCGCVWSQAVPSPPPLDIPGPSGLGVVQYPRQLALSGLGLPQTQGHCPVKISKRRPFLKTLDCQETGALNTQIYDVQHVCYGAPCNV